MSDNQVRWVHVLNIGIIVFALIAMLAGALTYTEFLLTGITAKLIDIHTLLWRKP